MEEKTAIEATLKNYEAVLNASGGGGILDLLAQMENTDIRGVALLIADWFNINGKPDDAGDQVEPEPVADSPSRSPGYIRELERELRQLLDAGDTEAVVRFVKTKSIESFRNGVEQGRASTIRTERNF